MSIALEIGRMAAEAVGPRVAEVVEVGVDVGDDSGVEPDSLEFCLEAVLATPPFTGATAVLNRCSGDVLSLAYLEVDDGRPDH